MEPGRRRLDSLPDCRQVVPVVCCLTPHMLPTAAAHAQHGHQRQSCTSVSFVLRPPAAACPQSPPSDAQPPLDPLECSCSHCGRESQLTGAKPRPATALLSHTKPKHCSCSRCLQERAAWHIKSDLLMTHGPQGSQPCTPVAGLQLARGTAIHFGHSRPTKQDSSAPIVGLQLARDVVLDQRQAEARVLGQHLR